MASGTLRIFLGAAPGVGKTFDMLGEAHRRLSRGTDVVVGLVETHGRRRTAEQIEGLEVLPRGQVTNRRPGRQAGEGRRRGGAADPDRVGAAVGAGVRTRPVGRPAAAAPGGLGTACEKETNYLRVYMAQLRRKLEPDPSNPRYLRTEPGMGNRLTP